MKNKMNKDNISSFNNTTKVYELMEFRDYMMKQEEGYYEAIRLKKTVEDHPAKEARFTRNAILMTGIVFTFAAVFCFCAPLFSKIDPLMQVEITHLYTTICPAPVLKWLYMLISVLYLCVGVPIYSVRLQKAEKSRAWMMHRYEKVASRNRKHYFSYEKRPPLDYALSNPTVISMIIYEMEEDINMTLEQAVEQVAKHCK